MNIITRLFSTVIAIVTIMTSLSIGESVAFAGNNVVADNLDLVYKIGQEVGYAETLQAILMQETHGGTAPLVGDKNLPVGKRSYGLMQVRVGTARSAFIRYPQIFSWYFPNRNYNTIMDEEIIALLLTNKDANVRIAAYTFKIYITMVKGDWTRAIAAYNLGIANAVNNPAPAEVEYVKGVKYQLTAVVRPFNKKQEQW